MRSRFCPVHQYNKDKPDKFRVDFFILADVQHYFIYHLDVYQGKFVRVWLHFCVDLFLPYCFPNAYIAGKNKSNVQIHESARALPMTMKAVINSVIQSGIANHPDGARRIFADN